MTGWPIIDKDTITRPVVEAALETLGQSPNDRESETYLDRVRPREYEAVEATAIENVECGNSVIVTAPFVKEFRDRAWINRMEAAVSASGGVTTIVWIHCDEDSMHRYMRQRGAARDAHKLADWKAYLATVDAAFRPLVAHEDIDNSISSLPLQAQASALVDKVLKRLP